MKAKFVYTGVRVKKMDESILFYTEILGMKLVERSRIGKTKGEIAILQSVEGGPVLELNCYDKESPYYSDYLAGEALDHLAFVVEDLDKAIEEAKSKGFPVVEDVKTEHYRWCYIRDPNDVWIELFQSTNK